jgi:hypothetical protein
VTTYLVASARRASSYAASAAGLLDMIAMTSGGAVAGAGGVALQQVAQDRPLFGGQHVAEHELVEVPAEVRRERLERRAEREPSGSNHRAYVRSQTPSTAV